MHCIQETHIEGSIFVVHLTFPSNTLTKFICNFPGASFSSLVCLGVILDELAETTLLY